MEKSEEYLNKISESLNVIEFYLSDLSDAFVKHPEGEFWDAYMEIRRFIFSAYKLRINKNRYEKWHKEKYLKKEISAFTLIEYAHELRVKLDKLSEKYK